MKRHYLGIIALGALGLQNVYAEDIKANENDTIKTYNMGEVIVTSSTKETNNLRQADRRIKGYKFFRPEPIHAGLWGKTNLGHLYPRYRSQK